MSLATDMTIIPPSEHASAVSLNSNGSKSLELSSQRDLLSPIELHTLDTVWHHVIPLAYKIVRRCACRSKKELHKTKVDKFIRFIYHKAHLIFLTLSTMLYIIWIVSGAYEINHILTSLVYWLFIIPQILLLYTANYRMFKYYLCNFTFWYKIISITIGVVSRQLIFDGSARFLTSAFHMISAVSFIISYFVASQTVAGLKAYKWPPQLTVVFIVLLSVLNVVQIWQIYSSHREYLVLFLGHPISLRNVSMSAYTNATVFYMKQLFNHLYHRDCMLQMVKLDWKEDVTSHDLYYSDQYNFDKSLSKSRSIVIEIVSKTRKRGCASCIC